jgi:hypothetical protein
MAQNILADGGVSVCISAVNYLDNNANALIEAQYVVNPALASPVVPDVKYTLNTPKDADLYYTAGSIMAESVKAFFRTAPVGVTIDVLPRKDLATGVKAVYDITITGPATSDGAIDLFMGGDIYSVTGLLVYSGDTVAVMAAGLASAIPASFPYDVAVTATGLRLTAKNAGTCGNYLTPVYNWKGLANYAPTGVAITVTRPVAGSGDPPPLKYGPIIQQCCYYVYALMGSDRLWQRGLQDWLEGAWDCKKPQCFGHAYTYNPGTLGQVLASGTNTRMFNRLAVAVNTVTFPFMRVAVQAALRANAFSNPEISIQGRTTGVQAIVRQPMSCLIEWEWEDEKTLRENGFVIDGPLAFGGGGLVSTYVHNDFTNYLTDDNGRPELTHRSTSGQYLKMATALKIAEKFSEFNGVAIFKGGTEIKEGIRGTNLLLIKAKMVKWLKEQVGVLFGDFDDIEKDFTVTRDFETAPPCKGDPGVINGHLRYNEPYPNTKVNVNIVPKLLDNCNRVATA